MKTLFSMLLLLTIGVSAGALGKDGDKPSKRKDIDFEGEVVEGAVKQSLDSLTQTSDSSKKKKKVYLYERRESFQDRSLERVDEILSSY